MISFETKKQNKTKQNKTKKKQRNLLTSRLIYCYSIQTILSISVMYKFKTIMQLTHTALTLSDLNCFYVFRVRHYGQLLAEPAR